MSCRVTDSTHSEHWVCFSFNGRWIINDLISFSSRCFVWFIWRVIPKSHHLQDEWGLRFYLHILIQAYYILFCHVFFHLVLQHWIVLSGYLCKIVLCHRTMPAFVIVIFNGLLLIRVIYNRHRIQQRIRLEKWQGNGRSIVDHLPYIYVVLNHPPMILYVAYSPSLPCNIAINYCNDNVIFTYWIVLFSPFASVISLLELRVRMGCVWMWEKNKPQPHPYINP